jgi:putative Mn2+ efflux pump MntP
MDIRPRQWITSSMKLTNYLRLVGSLGTSEHIHPVLGMSSGICFIKYGYFCPLVVLYVLIISFVKLDVFPQAMRTGTDNFRKVAKQKFL